MMDDNTPTYPLAPPVNDYEGDQWWEDWAERVKEEGDSE